MLLAKFLAYAGAAVIVTTLGLLAVGVIVFIIMTWAVTLKVLLWAFGIGVFVFLVRGLAGWLYFNWMKGRE